MRLLVTGGAGFIGSAVIRHIISCTGDHVVNVDKLTYAGNLESVADVSASGRYSFEHADVCDRQAMSRIFSRYNPDAVMHLAAESHVDRSIDGPAEFIQTNITGTYTLLEAARGYWQSLDHNRKKSFRFLHVSTDEVYGDLGHSGKPATEDSPYAPSSPYAASKASADHLVRSWHRTYKLPALITNCSNNYGPYHFPEKMIPLMILNAIEGRELPVYGRGDQVRDWLYVEDHARALHLVVKKGLPGETYNIGGNNQKTNMEVVRLLCGILDELRPDSRFKPHESLITNVEDRPGHDRRYAIDAGKIRRELGWEPQETFESGLRRTVEWYLENLDWCRRVQDGTYKRERLGIIKNSSA